MDSANPQLRDQCSPLESLTIQALRTYGEFHPSTIDADLALLFVDLANDVVSDWNTHPYVNTGSADLRVDEYISQTEARAIPDRVMIAGLISYYCMQQGSPKGQLYMPRYYRRLNRELWDMISGSVRPFLRPTDGGTNLAHSPVIDPITGRRR